MSVARMMVASVAMIAGLAACDAKTVSYTHLTLPTKA